MFFKSDHTVESAERREKEKMWEALKDEKSGRDHCADMLKSLNDIEKNIDVLIKIYTDKLNEKN